MGPPLQKLNYLYDRSLVQEAQGGAFVFVSHASNLINPSFTSCRPSWTVSGGHAHKPPFGTFLCESAAHEPQTNTSR